MSQSFFEAELEAVKSVITTTAMMTDPRAQASLSALIGAGGKLLRPQILLLSAMTGKYSEERIRPLAAAVELLHTATLLHDDVIDDSPLRRGLPSAHVRIGRKDAVLAGDFLFSRCFLLAANSTSTDNARGLAKAIDIMVSSEIAQASARWTFSPSIRACIRKISGKTAVLFALAARAGATEGKAPRQVISALSRASWAAGIAFQIQDDILDWSGDEKNLGKSVMNDVSEGLCTLPLAFALVSEKDRLSPLLNPEAIREGAAADVASIVKSSGSIDKASALAKKYCDRSLRDMGRLPPSFARDKLAQIFSSFINRSK